MPRALPTPPTLPSSLQQSSVPPSTPPPPTRVSISSRPALPTPPTTVPNSFSKKRNFNLQLPNPASYLYPTPGPPPTGALPPLPPLSLPPVPSRNAPTPRRVPMSLSVNVQNAQPFNSGLGISNYGPFGRGAVGLGSGLPPISASVLMTPESSTTQRLSLQAALTTALEEMRKSENVRRPNPGTGIPATGLTSSSSSSSSTLGSSGLASDRSDVSSSTAVTSAMGSDYHCKAKQDIRLITDPLQESDLKDLAELGMGNGGSVMKVEHVPSGIVMAKKIVLIDAKPTIRKQILRELHIMHACSSPYIVSSFGAFLSEPNICICMEFMDRGSFESIYKNIGRKIKLKGPRSSLLRANTWDSGDTEQVPGPIPIGIVRQVARCVLGGLVYLYEDMGVLHRDIKPSNILLNSEGQVKLCDFGVSGELENSVAKTFVGTSVYMSPERILGSDYTVKSDVWSLGVTLIELAHGCFPFSDTDEGESPLKSGSVSSATLPSALSKRASSRKSRRISVHTGVGSLSILELMHHIVQEPPPTLITPSVQHSLSFATEADEFVGNCLKKDPVARLNPRELLGTSWMDNDRTRKEMDLRTWAGTL